MVFRRTRRMVLVLLAVLQADLMNNAAVPSWFPIIAKPAIDLVQKYRDAADFPLQMVDKMAPQKGVKRHSAKLLNRLLYGSWLKFRQLRGKRTQMKNMILPFNDRFAVEQAINDTVFEELMLEVLNDNSKGTTAVFAEAGVGKSVAATLSVLKMEASQSKLTVLLKGQFSQNLKKFFRIQDIGDVEDVAGCFFGLLEDHGIRLQIVFDNAFDYGLEGEPLLALTRLAFEFGHHLIVVTQSKERADEVDKLNGDRTKIAKQQQGRMAEDFRWSEDLARQYLNATVMAEYQQQNGSSADGVMCRWLNGTRMRDQFGGWKPTIMNSYISGNLMLGEESPTSGTTSTSPPRAVWVRQLRKDGAGDFNFAGNAFKVIGAATDIDELKKAINPSLLPIEASKIDIYLQEDGRWKKVEKMGARLQDTDDDNPYGYILP